MKRLSVSQSSGHNGRQGWHETATRYRLVVEGVRVAVLATRIAFENAPPEFRVDFWTPKTRWKTGSVQRWENPIAAFSLISKEITHLYEEALNRGDTLVIEAACERRASIYLRIAKRLIAWKYGYEIVPLRDGDLPGFLVRPL